MRGITILAAVLLTGPGSGAAEPALLGAVITLTDNPGEPGAPTQTVTAARQGDRYSLTVRVSPGGNPKAIQSETRAISAAEFDRVWAVVTAQKLRAWLPEHEDGTADDFGERRVRVEWTTEASGKPQVHEVAWIKPLTNGEPAAKLRAALAALVKAHIRDLKLPIPL